MPDPSHQFSGLPRMDECARDFMLLEMSLHDLREKLEARGVRWDYAPQGSLDWRGDKSLGSICVKRGDAYLMFKCCGDFTEVKAGGIPSARGAKLYPAAEANKEFITRAVEKFLRLAPRGAAGGRP